MIDSGLLRHAFKLLAGVEFGAVPDWAGPDSAEQLQSRVELLGVLSNIIPRNQLRYLAEIAADWRSRFPADELVTARALREAAHAVVIEGGMRHPTDEADHDLRQIEEFLDVKVKPGTMSAASSSAREQCAMAMYVWRSQLRLGTEWTTLPGIGTNEARVPIEDVYVDLYASPRDDESTGKQLEMLSRSPRAGRMRPRGEMATIGVPSMIARTLEVCVVVGEPGSGKSTMIQWLAWATNKQMLPDFDFAVVVKLRHYASLLAERPELTPVELFLESLVPRFDDWKEAADCLRRAASSTRRVLLLLDGWDEVPAEMRDATRDGIHKEFPFFVVVITSRASGLPWQLVAKGHADFYEIAGLNPQTVRKFVERRLTDAEHGLQAQRVIEEIEAEPDLRAMAANPFILGLLVKVFSRPGRKDESPTLTELYQEIVHWVADQHRQVRQGSDKLVGAHLRALELLAYRLVFSEESPRYVFFRQELDNLLGSLNSEPLLESRFVNWVDRQLEGWTFLHATLEEYFAAIHLSELPEVDRNRIWDLAVCSQSRLVSLAFFAGMVSMRDVCRARVEFWLNNLDRFGMILLRMARLAKTGHWARHFPDLIQELYDKLWAQIRHVGDWRLARLFVEGFADLAPAELVRRATIEERVDGRVWEAICDLVPVEIIKEQGLFAKLPKQMQDHLTVQARERPAQATVDRITRHLNDDTLPKSELQKVLDEAALIADASIDLLLLKRLEGVQDEEFSATLVMALAPQFGVLPQEAVVDLLTEPNDLPSTVRQLASASLSHRKGRGARLDPESRDRILRRLASVRTQDARVGPLLDALTGFPIRDGGWLISEIALDRNLASATRISAIDVLETVSESGPVEATVAGAVDEPTSTVSDMLIDLGVKRHAQLPLEWLEARIKNASAPFTRRTLATAYLQMMNRLAAGYRKLPGFTPTPFLANILSKSLIGTTSDDHDQAWLWANALRTAESLLADTAENEEFREAARQALRRFVGCNDIPLGAVRLAAALLGGDANDSSIAILRRTLVAILAFLKQAKEKREILDFEVVAREIGDYLADTAVDLLLEYPAECESIREVLADRSRLEGWLVFSDRIFNADGNVVASTNVARRSDVELTGPMFNELMEELSVGERNSILSFILMTKRHRLCEDDAGYREINARLHQVAKGDKGSETAIQDVRELYGRKIPSLTAWRKALALAAAKLRLTPNGAQLLYQIGLPRRS